MDPELQELAKEIEQSTQSKRATYATRACLECKRRKIKCDGQKPCRRCATQEAPCIYQQANRRGRKESARPKWLNKTSGSTFDKFHGLYNQVIPISGVSGDEPLPPSAPVEQSSHTESPTQTYTGDETTPYRAPEHQSPSFYGPSSSEFTLSVVSGNLKAMGLNAVINDASTPEDAVSQQFSFEPAQYGPFMKMLTMDPLWDIKRADALRLICDFCRGPGSTYPIFDHHTMMNIANRVFGSLESAQGGKLKERGLAAAEAIFNAHTNKLKVVIAIGRTLESGGRSDQAQRLFQSVTEAVEGLLWNSDGICGIQLLVLVALYYYHLDDQVRTFRIIGFAARHCLEMGLHRRETILKTFRDESDRMIALRVLWSVYTLERRTSLSQGVPYSIQDSHIDPSLYTMDISNPFLSNMVEWTQLAGKAWQILNNQCEKASVISKDEIDFLDYQILRWYNQVPDELQLSYVRANIQIPDEDSYQDPLYLPTILYIRQNYLRNLIYRPILQSSTRIRENERYAHVAADVAKSSIATMWQLNQTTNLIGTHPIVFKHFVLSSFGNLSLLVVNATSQFWTIVRDEFHLALKLIRLLSTRSGPLMRLWKRLQGLEELQSKITSAATLATTAQASVPRQMTIPKDSGQQSDDFRMEFPEFSDPTSGSNSMTSAFEGSYIRDEFAGLFDQAADSDSFFDFPFTEFGK